MVPKTVEQKKKEERMRKKKCLADCRDKCKPAKKPKPKKAPAPLLKIRKQTAAKIAKRKPSKWVQLVKKRAKESGKSLKETMSDPAVREEYKASK